MNLAVMNQQGFDLVKEATQTLTEDQLAALALALQEKVTDPQIRTEAAVQAMTALSPADKVEATTATVKTLSSTEKETVFRGDGPFTNVTEDHRFHLWMTVIVVLSVLALASGIGACLLALNDKDFAAFIGLATAAVGGLIGMFSTSPTSTRSGSGA